jgi:hypothetical protein
MIFMGVPTRPLNRLESGDLARSWAKRANALSEATLCKPRLQDPSLWRLATLFHAKILRANNGWSVLSSRRRLSGRRHEREGVGVLTGASELVVRYRLKPGIAMAMTNAPAIVAKAPKSALVAAVVTDASAPDPRSPR